MKSWNTIWKEVKQNKLRTLKLWEILTKGNEVVRDFVESSNGFSRQSAATDSLGIILPQAEGWIRW